MGVIIHTSGCVVSISHITQQVFVCAQCVVVDRIVLVYCLC